MALDPVTAGLEAGGKALEATGNIIAAQKNAKANIKSAKIGAKESKRKTLADILNEALGREYDASKTGRQVQGELSGARARALQEIAAGIRQSLVR